MTTDNNPLDWSTSYSQYLMRSAAVAARTLKFYNDALERVSQAKLPPTIFSDHFPRFAQAHAAEYAAGLTEAASSFFGDLVRLGAALGQTHAGSESVAVEPEIVPTRFDPSNPARWFEQFAEYAGQLTARGIKTYRVQLDRVAAGDTTPSEAQQYTSDFLSRQAPAIMQRATRLYFDLLNNLTDVRARYEEAYFRSVLGEAHDEEREKPVILTFSGPPGIRASASLSVTNTTDQRTQITSRTTDVRRTDGVGRAFVPAITMFPESIELEPGAEGTLSFSLQLDPLQYDFDALYAGTLYVIGGTDLQVEVQLRIMVTPVESSTPATGLPA